MTSLRRQLLIWLLPLYVMSAGVAMLLGYRQYKVDVNAFMDGQIKALARSELGHASTPSGTLVEHPVSNQAAQHQGAPIVQYWSHDDRLLASSSPNVTAKLQSRSGFSDIQVNDQRWRAYTARTPDVSVQILQSDDFRGRVIFHSALKSGLPILVLIPLSIALLWMVVHLALRPVERLAAQLTGRDERNLGPLPLAKLPREIAPLVASMNALMQRLHEAFAAQQRFVQDAAHELRTPLTAFVLQTENLRAELGNDAPDELDRLEAGVRRHQRLVEQLLILAKHEALAQAAHEAVEIGHVLKESAAALLAIADSRCIDLGFSAFEECRACIDPHDLRRVFGNLIDNALRYTPEGGSVDIALRRKRNEIVVEITDTGPGIPAAALEQVFERFHRLPGNDAEGSGLGLAIVRAASRRGGFTVSLRNREDRGGLIAVVRMPLAV
ncbi:MAG: ATP-binding protein [Pseudomonadota bacterium]